MVAQLNTNDLPAAPQPWRSRVALADQLVGVILSGAKDLPNGARIMLGTKCDRSAFGRYLSSFGMTAYSHRIRALGKKDSLAEDPASLSS